MNSFYSSATTLIDSGTARKERDSFSWPTVEVQPIGVESRVDRKTAASCNIRRGGEAGTPVAAANQIKALRNERSSNIRDRLTGRKLVVAVSSTSRDDRALNCGTSRCLAVVINAATGGALRREITSHIKIQCAVADIESTFVVNATAVF